MKTIQVVLVENHWAVRQGLCSVLDPDPRFEVVGEAATEAEALRVARKQQPDVVLLDLKLSPGGSETSGSTLCRQLLQTSPKPAVLVLTAFLDSHLIEDCLRAGARGYLLKDAEKPCVKEQILTVARGHTALDPRAADVLADYVRQGEPAPEVLRPRELGVLRLVAQGLTNREIGSRLGRSEHRVSGYTKKVLTKLGAGSRVEAVLVARERGLV
jgi:two-component system response regulator DevR